MHARRKWEEWIEWKASGSRRRMTCGALEEEKKEVKEEGDHPTSRIYPSVIEEETGLTLPIWPYDPHLFHQRGCWMLTRGDWALSIPGPSSPSFLPVSRIRLLFCLPPERPRTPAPANDTGGTAWGTPRPIILILLSSKQRESKQVFIVNLLKHMYLNWRARAGKTVMWSYENSEARPFELPTDRVDYLPTIAGPGSALWNPGRGIFPQSADSGLPEVSLVRHPLASHLRSVVCWSYLSCMYNSLALCI